jgi:hypothetical protein
MGPLCCLTCWHRHERLVPAVNQGDKWRCDNCAEAIWLRSQEAR